MFSRPSSAPRTKSHDLKSFVSTQRWLVDVGAKRDANADRRPRKLLDRAPLRSSAKTEDRTSAPVGMAPVVSHGVPSSASLTGPDIGCTRFFVAALAMNPTG